MLRTFGIAILRAFLYAMSLGLLLLKCRVTSFLSVGPQPPRVTLTCCSLTVVSSVGFCGRSYRGIKSLFASVLTRLGTLSCRERRFSLSALSASCDSTVPSSQANPAMYLASFPEGVCVSMKVREQLMVQKWQRVLSSVLEV